MPDQDTEAAKARISRSQRKRDLELVFELATQLVARAPSELDRLPLDDAMREAIGVARETPQHGAHKRQLKRVAGLLREGDLAAVQEAVAGLTRARPGDRARLHQVERWRERLLEPGDAALTELIAAHPTVDRQRLRQLQKSARTPASEEKGKRAAKALFKVIAEALREDT